MKSQLTKKICSYALVNIFVQYNLQEVILFPYKSYTTNLVKFMPRFLASLYTERRNCLSLASG